MTYRTPITPSPEPTSRKPMRPTELRAYDRVALCFLAGGIVSFLLVVLR